MEISGGGALKTRGPQAAAFPFGLTGRLSFTPAAAPPINEKYSLLLLAALLLCGGAPAHASQGRFPG